MHRLYFAFRKLAMIGLLVCASVATMAAAVPNPAVNSPDAFAWSLVTKVVVPAATPGNNNVLFETWANDSDTFKIPPVFPTNGSSRLQLHPPALNTILQKRFHLRVELLPTGGSEEVRRNQAAFEYIVKNNFHTADGLKAAFAHQATIAFPPDAIEVKADWVPLTNDMDKTHYHINQTPDGKSFALVSLHVISKVIPNWTWATIEQESNKGRCDFIGCHDAFGAVNSDVAPEAKPGSIYPPCVKTPALEKLFAEAKISDVWKHYCLKGSQIDFTDSTGRPTHLGNSVTESGFVNTSSCITCHGRGAVDANAQATSGGGFLNPAPPTVCPTGSPCSPNGPLDPNWFWDAPGTPTQKMTALQTDFVWAIPLCAVPSGQKTGGC